MMPSRRADEQTSRREVSLVPSEQVRSARDLLVYKKAYALSLILHRVTLTFPAHERYVIGDQLRRAGLSVCANLVEGYAKKYLSIPEFRRFLKIAYGSSEEISVWLDYAKDLGYLPKDKYDELFSGYQEFSKMLWSLIKSWSQDK